MEKNLKKYIYICVCVCVYVCTHTYIAESLCCSPETNATFYINYTSIFKKILFFLRSFNLDSQNPHLKLKSRNQKSISECCWLDFRNRFRIWSLVTTSTQPSQSKPPSSVIISYQSVFHTMLCSERSFQNLGQMVSTLCSNSSEDGSVGRSWTHLPS